MKNQIIKYLLILAINLFGSVGIAMISDGKELPKEPKFDLKGSAFLNEDGKILIIIKNTSAENCDYFIAAGDPVIEGISQKNQQILKIKIVPTVISGGMFIRIASSDAQDKLLIGNQMLRVEIKLPDEYKSKKIDIIRFKLNYFKAPVLSEKISISSSTIEMNPRANQ